MGRKALALPDKVCPSCGRPFGRREGEAAQTYRWRRYCSRRCANLRGRGTVVYRTDHGLSAERGRDSAV